MLHYKQIVNLTKPLTGLLLGLLVLVSVWDAQAAEGHAARAKHKSRVRNTPEVDVTPAGHWKVSEELNFYAAHGNANTTVDYGLPWAWNAGFSLLNVDFYNRTPDTMWIQPDLLFNLEKSLRLTENWGLIAGTQIGTAFFHNGSTRLMDFSYLDSQWRFADWDGSLHLGGYYANANMAGLKRDATGWHINTEIPLINNKLSLEGDYLSGRNSVGGASVKLNYTLTRRWSISFGVQIPAARTGNDFSGLLGVYWSN